MKYLITILFVTLGILLQFSKVDGHGMMVDPIHRGSRWRCDSKAPANYDDNQLFCGGFAVQWETHKGKCGLCGDSWGDKTPRAHELGGKYGQGVVVKSYKKGSIIEVGVLLTANHMGHFEFDLCDAAAGETEACFTKHKLLTDKGQAKWKVPSGTGQTFKIKLQLPKTLECKHCIIRWTYVCGNNWGQCGNGTGAVGCGPQEHFRSCSDIAIKAALKVEERFSWTEVCKAHKNYIEEIIADYKEREFQKSNIIDVNAEIAE